MPVAIAVKLLDWRMPKDGTCVVGVGTPRERPSSPFSAIPPGGAEPDAEELNPINGEDDAVVTVKELRPARDGTAVDAADGTVGAIVADGKPVEI
jgi:hypothetical protein